MMAAQERCARQQGETATGDNFMEGNNDGRHCREKHHRTRQQQETLQGEKSWGEMAMRNMAK